MSNGHESDLVNSTNKSDVNEILYGDNTVAVYVNDVDSDDNGRETDNTKNQERYCINTGFADNEHISFYEFQKQTKADIPDVIQDQRMKNGSANIKTDLFNDASTNPALNSNDCVVTGHDLLWQLFRICVCMTCGMVFGFCSHKGLVFEPKTIRDQMVFESFIMLKMFLSAVVSGQIIFSLLSVLPPTKKLFQEAVIEYIACFGSKGIFTSALGAVILGAGMTLAGACPGMVLAQVGSWVPNSIFTLLGCLIGALSYGMIAPLIEKYTKPKTVFKHQTVNQTLKWPYVAITLPMSAMLFVAVFVLEYYWDYTKDLKNINRALPPYDNIITAVAWRPSVAGAIIGLLQLPLIFTVHDTMGGSTSYVTMVSQWVVTKKLQETFPYLAKTRCGLGNWWQVVYVWGAILGAALASIASDTMATSKGVTLPTAIIGGILMLWGARLASGCTSGHGLSGMGLLAWLSFIAVPFMFIGGIVTAFSMQATGALDDYVEYTLDT